MKLDQPEGEPLLRDPLSYVIFLSCSLGRSHETGMTVFWGLFTASVMVRTLVHC